MHLQQLVTKCVIALMLLLSVSSNAFAQFSEVRGVMPTDCVMNIASSDCCTSMTNATTDSHHFAHDGAANQTEHVNGCCNDEQCHSSTLQLAILADSVVIAPFTAHVHFTDPAGERQAISKFIFRPPTAV
ncbi:hypothetical protein [Photobacterium nomapromontoriensis]|uniref:hypothetical protein n=1 Tax=Photobacterium nomapromontoriensis TaxID=2910237 RepID=UPI003D0F77A9